MHTNKSLKSIASFIHLKTIQRTRLLTGTINYWNHKSENFVLLQSDSCTPSSRQSIASLSSVSSCTDTLTPRGSWASFDLRSSVNDPLINGLLDRLPPEQIDQTNETRRVEDRQEGLFSMCIENDPEDAVERRLPVEIPIEHVGHRIMVKCIHLKLELEVEPIFASMAIYDAKEKKKLSENFYFDMNTDGLKRMLSAHVPYSDVSTQSRSAIFEISNPSSDLFLVIRLEKVLQGDSVEPYLKEDKDKVRTQDVLFIVKIIISVPFSSITANTR